MCNVHTNILIILLSYTHHISYMYYNNNKGVPLHVYICTLHYLHVDYKVSLFPCNNVYIINCDNDYDNY